MEDFNLSEFLKPWALRILQSNKSLDKLFKHEELGHEAIAEWLGFKELKRTTVVARKKHFNALCNQYLKEGKRELPVYIQRNFSAFSKLLELNSVEQKLLQFIVFRDEFEGFRRLHQIMRIKSRKAYCERIAYMLDESPDAVIKALGTERSLMGSSLVVWNDSKKSPPWALGREDGIQIELTQLHLFVHLLSDNYSDDEILRSIAKIVPKGKLSYSDYPHIRENLDLLRPYLRNACRERQKGVNIFIYGPTGTGKSELARTLARDLRQGLFEVPFEGEDGDAIKAVNRLNALNLAQSFMSKRRAILLFDEAEDIFEGPSFFLRSIAVEHKAWMNRMLEQNPVPTIWISNTISRLDPAFARRFDFIFELKSPPRKQRLLCLKKICGKDISTPVLEQLSESDAISLAVASRAHSVAIKSCGAEKHKRDTAFKQLIRNTLVAQGHDAATLKSKASPLPEVYSPSLLNVDADMQAIAEGLKHTPNCRICLYGPPGTGKTSFGHWLARELDLRLKISRASDILSPFVGVSERKIAKLFEEATQDGGILMIDEVDSFLQDRRQARHSWEITLINEMLTQMEQFNGTFIASTNLMEGMDQASLRRFDLKIRVNYLSDKQIATLADGWVRQLGLTPPSPKEQRRISLLDNATPGDFANAARQNPFRQFENGDAFIDAVVQECAMKESGGNRSLGFTAD